MVLTSNAGLFQLMTMGCNMSVEQAPSLKTHLDLIVAQSISDCLVVLRHKLATQACEWSGLG
jgi:hypothetical protein